MNYSEVTFKKGTIARCNRCDAQSPLPKDVVAVPENSKCYRVQSMAILDCGHLDCHWVFVVDLVEEE